MDGRQRNQSVVGGAKQKEFCMENKPFHAHPELALTALICKCEIKKYILPRSIKGAAATAGGA